MSINQTEVMRILVAIAGEGGFSAAARKLRLQQSSVSRSISSLENELGVALLNRTTRKISFTEDGLTYLAESRRILTEIDNLNASVRKTREVPQGTLRISLSTAFGKWVVIPVLAEFKMKYPEVSLEVHLEDRLVDIVSEAYDVVIRVGETEDSRVTSRKIAIVRRGIFVSKKLMKTLGPIRNPTDLERYPAVIFDDRADPAATWTFTQSKTRLRIRFKSATAVNQLDGVYRLVCDGLGVAQLPLFIGSESGNTGQLEQVLPEWDFAGEIGNYDRVYALFTGGRKMSAKVRVFLDYLVKKLSQIEGDRV